VGLCGLLNLNKPSGMTSREVVNVVQRRLPRRTKVGHAGTLDPLASGVLVVCLGAATRLIQYVQGMPKHYQGEFLLGRRSATEDTEGEVTTLECPPIPTREQVVAAASKWIGVIQQRPPAYSAVKVRGRRAYDLARRGDEVELAARPVIIHRLEVRDYDYPRLVLDVVCGSGTYIRSLGRDLAESLGTACVMSGLERTAIGGFSIDEAVSTEGLSPATWREYLLPPLRAVGEMPRVVLSPEELVEIGHGRTIAPPGELPKAIEYAGVDDRGHLVAILVPRGLGLGPTHNLSTEE